MDEMGGNTMYVSNNLLGDGLVDQIIEAGATNGLEHILDIVLSGTNMSVNVLRVRVLILQVPQSKARKGEQWPSGEHSRPFWQICGKSV